MGQCQFFIPSHVILPQSREKIDAGRDWQTMLFPASSYIIFHLCLFFSSKVPHYEKFLEKKVKKIFKNPFTNRKTCDNIYLVRGALAQLVAHNTGSVGVRSSNLLCSTQKSEPIIGSDFFLFSPPYPYDPNQLFLVGDGFG